MLLVAWLVTEAIVLYWIVTHLSVYTWGSTLFLYACIYLWLDDGEKTGFRSWNRGRTLWVWKHLLPVSTMYANQDKLLKHNGPTLYLVVGSITPLSLLYGFGLNPPTTMCSFVLPRFYFYVPFLRDILLCCGAVADGPLTMLHRSIAVPVDETPERSVFEACREQKISVVPVLVSGEAERYYQSSFIHFPRIFGRVGPAQIQISIGPLMNPTGFETAEAFQDLFVMQIKALRNHS